MNLIPRNFFLDDIFDDLGKTKYNEMKCDIYEKDNNYVVEMDIPGFNKDEISVDVEKGYLTISAEHDASEKSFEENVRDTNEVIKYAKEKGLCRQQADSIQRVC